MALELASKTDTLPNKDALNKTCSEVLSRLKSLEKQPTARDILGAHYDWVMHTLAFEHPVTDPDLRRERGSQKLVPSYFGSLESSSWNINPSGFIQRTWDELTKETTDLLQTALTQRKDISQDLTALKEKYWAKAEAHLRTFFTDLATRKNIQEENIYVLGSGALAITFAEKALGKAGTPSVTTKENGSQVLAGLEQGGLTKIDIRNPKTNEPYDDDTMFSAYSKAMDEGAQFISVTMVSKTEVSYQAGQDKKMSLADRVLAEVQRRNADPQTPHQIRVILDVVQMGGRQDFNSVLSYLNSSAIDGIAFSGSKAPGGSPHAGFFIASVEGQKHIQEMLQRTEKDTINRWSTEHQLVESKLLTDNNFDTKKNLLTALRAGDNARAWNELNALPEERQLYGERARALSQELHEFLSFLGFNIVGKTADTEKKDPYSSIIPCEPPLGIPAVAVKEVFLKELADRGVFLGGFLQESLHVPPILRVSVPVQWLKDAVTVSQLQEALYGSSNAQFITDLKEWRKKAPKANFRAKNTSDIKEAIERKKLIDEENNHWRQLSSGYGMLSLVAQSILEARNYKEGTP